MTDPDKPTGVPPGPTTETVRRRVAGMLAGSPLRIEERANELVVTNPRDPESGMIHVAYADGYVCWERVTWQYWGHLKGCEPDHDVPDASVNADKIISTLSSSRTAPEGM